MTAPDLMWRKSSFSSDASNCVEVAWRKSRFSTNASNCVEVAFADPAAVAVRDSKNQDGPTLAVPVVTWHSFISDLHKR